jgi:hypothetical protein
MMRTGRAGHAWASAADDEARTSAESAMRAIRFSDGMGILRPQILAARRRL